MSEEQAKKPKEVVAAKTPDASAPENAEVKKKKKGKKRNVPVANVAITASFNNTIVTISEPNGDVICWSSAGASGFKGTRKATPYAATIAIENALNKAKFYGVERVTVTVRGIGTGRDQALRAISASGVAIESISEKTAIPHNGCRPRKARRV